MSDERAFDFKLESDRLVMAASLIAGINVAGILEAIERAHTLGPIVDPTAYAGALHRGSLDQVAALARAGRDLQRAFEAIPQPKPEARFPS